MTGSADYRRILVIKLGALGDFVLAMGPLAAIRAQHPDAHITLLTTPPFAALGDACGYVDTVLPFGRPQRRDLRGLLQLVQTLHGGGFERVYDLQTSTRSSFYRWFSRSSEWSGIARGCSHPHANPRRNLMHTLDRQAEQLAMAGIGHVPPPDLSWANADMARFNLPEAYALLVPGGSAHRPAKRWPAACYGALAQRLVARGIVPLILGAGPERALADEIEAICPDAVCFTDRTDFLDIICLARGAQCAVGNDTGPMHLAAAAGCASLVLFSATSDPALCAPRGTAVTILQHDPLEGLVVDEVAACVNI